MNHTDIYVAIGIALVLLLVITIASKMLIAWLKWVLYLGVIAAAVIYVAVRAH